MKFIRTKIGNTFLLLILLYFFGYTSILGGPFGLARFLFVVILIGTLLFSIFIYLLSNFLREKTRGKVSDEKIKVDAKIIE
jgi:uncharacterized membrane protein